MVKDKTPTVVFLMETKMTNGRLGFLKNKLGLDNLFAADCRGLSGGVDLFWKNTVHLGVQSYSVRHISVVFKSRKANREWKFTGFYGHPEPAKREEPWALLRHLSMFQPIPWLCMGDYNEKVSQTEKRGAAQKPCRQIEAFQRALEVCKLCDLGFSGPKYTWTNGRSGGAFTKERLDCGLANDVWHDIYGSVEVQVLANLNSDHNPVLVSFQHKDDIKWLRCKRFHVEASWSKCKDYKGIVRKVWRDKVRMDDK
jgi:hypothetical protein